MFNKVKQAADTISQLNRAREIQKQLAKVEHSEEKGSVRVKVSGVQQLVYMEIDGVERKDIVDLINKAMQEVQKKVALEHKDDLMNMLLGK